MAAHDTAPSTEGAAGFDPPHPGSQNMPPWNGGELVDAPVFTWKNWLGLLGPGLIAAVVLTIGGALLLAMLDAMQAMRATPPVAFDVGAALWRLSHPADVGGWVTIVGLLAFAIVGGMFIAATRVKRA